MVVEVTGKTGDLGEMAKVTVGQVRWCVKTGELGEKGVVTGELGEGGVEVSGWRLAPMKQRSRHKNMMKNVEGSKTGQLENEAAGADTSDGESYVSDCSEVSHADIWQSRK